MKDKHFLLACLDRIGRSDTIKARFFYVCLPNKKEDAVVTEVTHELCELIKERNSFIDHFKNETGSYETKIPYEYRNGFARYSYGCGATHYLSEQFLPLLEIFRKPYSKFPIGLCEKIRVWAESDLRLFHNITNIGRINDLASEIQQVIRKKGF